MADTKVIHKPEFLQSIVGFEQIFNMFDLLTDVIFWIKDTDSQIIYANKKFVEHLGCHSLHQVIGKSDDAFFPPHIAKQFINEVRLESSRRMLIETRLPIAEIAYRCGFSEHSYFSRQVKLQSGILPSQLRESMKD